jgi:hypothetical protein
MHHSVMSVAAGLAVVLGGGAMARAAFQPYGTPDANTTHLYHFEETSGAFLNAVAGGVNLTDTGGATGRNGTTAGGYGATQGAAGSSFAGYGAAFLPLGSGRGTATNASGSTTYGGGAGTEAAVGISTLTGADGAFSWEAVVRSDTGLGTGPTPNWYILSHDGGNTSRGSSLQIEPAVTAAGASTVGALTLTVPTYTAAGTPTGSTNLSVAVPRSGDNAFALGQYFHVAVTYDGNEGVAGNVKFYWTKLTGADPTEAALAGTATLAADLADGNNRLFVGGIARNPYRFEFPGRVDKVRISNVARAATDFGNVVVPEPAALGLLAFGGLLLARRRRVG